MDQRCYVRPPFCLFSKDAWIQQASLMAAGLEACCCSLLQQERVGSGLCLAHALCRPGRMLSRATQLGTVCSRTSRRAAVARSGCCRLSHGLCLTLLVLPAKCMGLLDIQCSGQSHCHLPLEHPRSGEHDLPALLSAESVCCQQWSKC